ncbi:SLC39A10 [Acanthosepion pharaonis]|uniref:SLC39A10 n=1 Tax=Acanthosepion pharaonis TaxID=158019 RepID=A0A812D936_ACAPH|nr:SLC39A10 [Sepia pharaonis]
MTSFFFFLHEESSFTGHDKRGCNLTSRKNIYLCLTCGSRECWIWWGGRIFNFLIFFKSIFIQLPFLPPEGKLVFFQPFNTKKNNVSRIYREILYTVLSLLASPFSSKCLSVTDYLTAFQYSSNSSLTLQQFLGLCPALIQHHNKEPCEERNVANIPLSVWLWSSLAVIGISVVGLLGVIVIPFMQKVFYNHLLQCLVAVAIGALTGDALLHLLPHALSKDHTHQVCHNELTNHKHDKTSILKGLVGLLGIIIFFIIERVMTIFTLMRTDKRKKRKRSCSQVATISEGETDIGGKLSTHRSRNSHYQSCEDVVMMVHPNRALKDLAEDSHADLIECSHQQVHQSDEEHTTMMSPSHNHTNHDHSHFYQSHGHSHFPSPLFLSYIFLFLFQLPEISSVETREGEHPFFHLFIQCLGLLIGAGIMWLIAYYEHDLINAL